MTSGEQNSQLPRIVVLYGGVGPEREVSLVSGQAVLKGLLGKCPYEVKGIELFEKALPSDLQAKRDVVLLVLHGEFGEDGQVQALLEQAGIHYGGCDSSCSILCMDKAVTKRIWSDAGLPIVPGIVLPSAEHTKEVTSEVIEKLGHDLIVKPVDMGSSVDLHLFDHKEGFEAFLERAEVRAQRWLIERRIRGREFSVGILNGFAMGIVEIKVPVGRVYDYEQKYHRNDTVYECPASISEESTAHLKQLAERAFDACGCRDYARIDFLYDPESDQWFCLELNTLPGMTPTSLLPKSGFADGYDFSGLLLKMIEPAVLRFSGKSR